MTAKSKEETFQEGVVDMAERKRMKTSWLSMRKTIQTLRLLKEKNRLALCDVAKESINVEAF